MSFKLSKWPFSSNENCESLKLYFSSEQRRGGGRPAVVAEWSKSQSQIQVERMP